VSWVHDTGYGLALDHEGGIEDVLEDGTDPSTPPDQIGPRVIGWRSACQCGWQGTQFHLRSEWAVTEYGLAPDEVEQHCMAEWERHLRVALPLLAVHDLSQQIAHAQAELADAVAAVRADGVSWTVIGEAAGVTAESAQERWSAPADHAGAAARQAERGHTERPRPS
jgi:hypothetical protein